MLPVPVKRPVSTVPPVHSTSNSSSIIMGDSGGKGAFPVVVGLTLPHSSLHSVGSAGISLVYFFTEHRPEGRRSSSSCGPVYCCSSSKLAPPLLVPPPARLCILLPPLRCTASPARFTDSVSTNSSAVWNNRRMIKGAGLDCTDGHPGGTSAILTHASSPSLKAELPRLPLAHAHSCRHCAGRPTS